MQSHVIYIIRVLHHIWGIGLCSSALIHHINRRLAVLRRRSAAARLLRL